MSAVATLKRDIAIQNTNANHYQVLLNKANSDDKLAELAIELQQLAIVHGRGLIEARFWLGAVVAKGHSRNKIGGTDYIGRLARNTGVSSATLRKSMNFYDLFRGDPEEMYKWCSSYIDRHGSLLWSDVTKILSVNRVLLKKNRQYRYNKKTIDRISKIKKGSGNYFVEKIDRPRVEALQAELAEIEIMEPLPNEDGNGFVTKTDVLEFNKTVDEEVNAWINFRSAKKILSLGGAKQELLNLYQHEPVAHTILFELLNLGDQRFNLYLTLEPVETEGESA